MLKRTPLFELHRQLGARLVEFGGWEMPVQYSSIVDEHLTVRKAAGIFDISHMGQFRVTGPTALPFLNYLLTNNVSKLTPGQGQYTLLCNNQGGTVDDLYIYQIAPHSYLLIVNASRIETDFAWLQNHFQRFPDTSGTQLLNRSAESGAIALQGPTAREFIDQSFPDSHPALSALKKNEIQQIHFQGQEAWVACTGYTGEDGFEIAAPAQLLVPLWTTLSSFGQPHGLKPAGLGCRDTLRTEMGYPLYGHELDESTSPLEAGLGKFVDLEKPDFIGRAALLAQKAGPLRKKSAAFVMTEKSAPPRPGYPIWNANRSTAIGSVASGTQSPSLNLGIGMGFVPPDQSEPGTPLHIEIRGKFCPATVVRKPIYRPH